MHQVNYQAFRRTKEIWSPIPLTNNLRFWLAVLSFSTAIFAIIDGRWEMTWQPLTPLEIGVFIIGSVSVLGIATALISFLILGCRGLFGIKVEVDPSNMSPYIKDGLSKKEKNRIQQIIDASKVAKPSEEQTLQIAHVLKIQIDDLREAKRVLDNLFVDLPQSSEKNDKSKT